MSSLAHPDTVFLGLDVHKDFISAGILNPGHDRADVERIFNDEESIRRLIGRFPEPRLLRVCYEAELGAGTAAGLVDLVDVGLADHGDVDVAWRLAGLAVVPSSPGSEQVRLVDASDSRKAPAEHSERSDSFE